MINYVPNEFYINDNILYINDINDIPNNPIYMLTAIRLSILYDLIIDKQLKNYILENKKLINKATKKDITNEFRFIFRTTKSIKNIFIEYVDIITEIIPEIKICVNFNQNNKYHIHDVYEHMLWVTDYTESDNFIIKMSALLHDIGKPKSYTEDKQGYGHFYGHPKISMEICKKLLPKRFALTEDELSRILELIEYHDMPVSNDENCIKKILKTHSMQFLRDWIILKSADIKDHVFPEGKKIISWQDIRFMEPLLDKIEQDNLN